MAAVVVGERCGDAPGAGLAPSGLAGALGAPEGRPGRRYLQPLRHLAVSLAIMSGVLWGAVRADDLTAVFVIFGLTNIFLYRD
jgi:hypothetical protein